MKKPIISYWKSSDPCLYVNKIPNLLTDINIINTKRLTDEFIDLCLQNKHRLYIHLVITGMGKTPFEPNIPTVKETFYQLKKLIDLGFPRNQILVIINPIIPNQNGLNALKLLLKLFTEFKLLRLRQVRFNVLIFKNDEKTNKLVIANDNITKRPAIKSVQMYLSSQPSFWKDYYKLLDDYISIIGIDKGDEPLIGVRELQQFGYKNEWFNELSGKREKLITYKNNNKYKPEVNIISAKKPTRCLNRCLLCPHLY